MASYLINAAALGNDLESLAAEYLNICREVCEEGQVQLTLGAEPAADKAEDAFDAAVVSRLREPLSEGLKRMGMEALFRDLELPLAGVLAAMEMRGVAVDLELLRGLSESLEGRITSIERDIYEAAGERFNIGSPRQVGRILFEKLGLPAPRKTKTGYTTDAATLEKLKDEPLPAMLLEYRELAKLKNTYVDALPRLVSANTGKLHTSFNQTIAATGRLSSSNPNLQNIPVRTELGRQIRRAFIPAMPGGSLMVADYSQIELRILAHLSGDKELTRAFREGLDVHTVTAMEVFDLPADEIGPEHRRKAKIINFGIVYGMSPHGLAEQLQTGREEAEEYIRAYFARYPGVAEYRERQVTDAAANGYVSTLLGRRRPIPELASHDGRLRVLGERLAQNTPIQGSAADLIKLAMLNIQRRLRGSDLSAYMILQLHDELVFEFEEERHDELRALVEYEMCCAMELSVPVRVEIGTGPNWNDAK